MSRVLVLLALAAILAAHFVLPSSLLMFSALAFAFALTNFIRQNVKAGDAIIFRHHPAIDQALWWAVFIVLSYRILMLIADYLRIAASS